jgi:hypothetical protein
VLLESIDVLAVKDDRDRGRRDLFTGRQAIYLGRGAHVLSDAGEPAARSFAFASGMPVPVSDRVAAELALRADFLVTPPTFHARTAGCC